MTVSVDMTSVTTRRSRYWKLKEVRLVTRTSPYYTYLLLYIIHLVPCCTVVSRPQLLSLPYHLISDIFVQSQNPALLRTCHVFRNLGLDSYIRARYLIYQFYHAHDPRTANETGCFFTRMLERIPPSHHHQPIRTVLKNRGVLNRTLQEDAYKEMKRKESQMTLNPILWHPRSVFCRTILLAWLAECCEDFNWAASTRHLAVTLMDLYLTQDKARCSVSVENVQVIAGVCLSIASKANESHLTSNRLMAQVSQTTSKHFLHVELHVLQTVQWNVAHCPTAESFLAYFVVQLPKADSFQVVTPPLSDKHVSEQNKQSLDITNTSEILNSGRYLRALANLDQIMVVSVLVSSLKPSLMAAWALWKGELQVQPGIFERVSGYSTSDLVHSDKLVNIHTSRNH